MIIAADGRAQFGGRLRVLREDARLTGKDMAARLGWAQSTVSRLENGKQTATTDDVAAWAWAVGASDEQRNDLLAELRSMRFECASWRQQLRSGTAQRQRVNIGSEANAAVVRVFVPEMVPGLLQTAEYARHVFARLVRTGRGGRRTGRRAARQQASEASQVTSVREDERHEP